MTTPNRVRASAGAPPAEPAAIPPKKKPAPGTPAVKPAPVAAEETMDDGAPAGDAEPADDGEQDLHTKVSGLEGRVASLHKQCGAQMAEISKLRGQLADANIEKANGAKAAKFDEMLAKGKVCKAQREAFMTDDFAKFAELQGSVNLSETGDGEEPGEEIEATTPQDAQMKVLEKARAMFADDQKSGVKKFKSMDDARRACLSMPENKKLRDTLYPARAR